MRKIVTKRLAPVSLAFVLGLGMSAVGCKGKDGPDAPDGGNGQQLPDEVKKQKKKEADAEFMKVVAEYQKADDHKGITLWLKPDIAGFPGEYWREMDRERRVRDVRGVRHPSFRKRRT